VEFLLAGIAGCLELGFLDYGACDYEHMRFAIVFSVCKYCYYEAWKSERGQRTGPYPGVLISVDLLLPLS